MASALPLLLVGGAALLLMGKKKNGAVAKEAPAEKPAPKPAAPPPPPGLPPGEHDAARTKNYQLGVHPGSAARTLRAYKDGAPADVFVTASPFVEKIDPGHYEMGTMADNIVVRFLAAGVYEVSLFGDDIDARWVFRVK